jgi:hypothetical protein
LAISQPEGESNQIPNVHVPRDKPAAPTEEMKSSVRRFGNIVLGVLTPVLAKSLLLSTHWHPPLNSVERVRSHACDAPRRLNQLLQIFHRAHS